MLGSVRRDYTRAIHRQKSCLDTRQNPASWQSHGSTWEKRHGPRQVFPRGPWPSHRFNGSGNHLESEFLLYPFNLFFKTNEFGQPKLTVILLKQKVSVLDPLRKFAEVFLLVNILCQPSFPALNDYCVICFAYGTNHYIIVCKLFYFKCVSAFWTLKDQTLSSGSYSVRYLRSRSQVTWFCLYRQKMSPRVSDWKSHGETKTTSPSLIHTRRFSLPRILHNRSLPSWHLTMIRSAPSIFTATPKMSPVDGRIIWSCFPSFVIFRLPILQYPLNFVIRISEKK